MWVFLNGRFLGSRMQHTRHTKIIGSVFEMSIMVFVLATERSHFGSVTP